MLKVVPKFGRPLFELSKKIREYGNVDLLDEL
jgi:hypothetical protein